MLVRYLVADDPRKAAAAQLLVEGSCIVDSPGFVALVVVCELVWVLAQGYGYSREQVALVLRRLLAAQDLAVERSELAWQALKLYEDGTADYSDYVIALCRVSLTGPWAFEWPADIASSFRRPSVADDIRVLSWAMMQGRTIGRCLGAAASAALLASGCGGGATSPTGATPEVPTSVVALDAVAFGDASYLVLWKRLPPPSATEEVLRNLPIRHPLLWTTE